MSSSLHPTRTGELPPDRQLPGHRRDLPHPAPIAVRAIGSVVSAVGVGVVAALSLIGAPIVAFVTGMGSIRVEIRETTARPRPFVGARHGLPFLDRMGTSSVETEE